jgi:hypothetical protein
MLGWGALRAPIDSFKKKEAIVQEHFKTRVWLSITQHFGEGNLLLTEISHARGHHGGEQNNFPLIRSVHAFYHLQ